MSAKPLEPEMIRTIRSILPDPAVASISEPSVTGPRLPVAYFSESDGIVKTECSSKNFA